MYTSKKYSKNIISYLNKNIQKFCKKIIYNTKNTFLNTSIGIKVQDYIIQKPILLSNISRYSKISSVLLLFFIFAYVLLGAETEVAPSRQLASANYIDIKETENGFVSLDNVISEENDTVGRFVYTVQAGDSIDTIAQDFGVTSQSIKDINNLPDRKVKPGQELIITVIEGIIYEANEDMTLLSFAAKYGISIDDLKELNYISDDNQKIEKGTEIFLPITYEEAIKLGIIQKEDEDDEAIIKDNNENQSPAQIYATHKKGSNTNIKTSSSKVKIISPTPKKNNNIQKVKIVKPKGSTRRLSNNGRQSFGFALGHCTWYAAQMRPDIFVPGRVRPFGGNARNWYRNAANAGFGVGKTPAIGAIAVMKRGRAGYGHVGIVRGFDGDSVIIESMNFRGRFVVSQDKIARNTIFGYIY